jgi:hypothetical protein
MNRMNKFTNLIDSGRTAIIKKREKSKPALFARRMRACYFQKKITQLQET